MGYMPLSVIVTAVGTSVQSTQTTMLNASGSTIAALTPIRVDGNGEMQLIDVSTEISALSIVGVTVAAVTNNNSGTIMSQGRLLDITTSFAVGDYVYVGSNGALINILPQDGFNGFVGGDYIIRIGVIAKNELDSNKKDLFISICIVGQL